MKQWICSLFLVALLLIASTGQSQQEVLAPGENVFVRKWIRNDKYDFSYAVVNNGTPVEIGSFALETVNGQHTFSIYTRLSLLQSPDQWVDTSIADLATYRPIYRSSFNKTTEMVLKYDNQVSGYYLDKQTKKRTIIKDPVHPAFFDSYLYPYLLAGLPLNTGYRKQLSVYEYKPDNKSNVKRTVIEEVKSGLYNSRLSGPHMVWVVQVLETGTNDQYIYHIDKDTRRIWKVEIFSKGQQILLTDKELDYSPFKNKFDKEQTLSLVKDGNSVIKGQAFARDNQSPIKGIGILNINKRQYAVPGTSIVLIPYTDFFKEWLKLDQSLRKKGRSIALPPGAKECIKVATVYDEQGHFEFTNLMPGEYLLYTSFEYVHKATATEVVGYTDTYLDGMYMGTTENTTSYSYNTNAIAAVKNIVTIKKNGDSESVKLKKTL